MAGQIGVSNEARMQIITEALKLIDANAHEAEKESRNVRHRLNTVKAAIGTLVTVQKDSGNQMFESIRDELSQLESEKRDLESKQRELQQRKTPLDQMMALAKTFVENWQGLFKRDLSHRVYVSLSHIAGIETVELKRRSLRQCFTVGFVAECSHVAAAHMLLS